MAQFLVVQTQNWGSRKQNIIAVIEAVSASHVMNLLRSYCRREFDYEAIPMPTECVSLSELESLVRDRDQKDRA
ncbi:MAG: hypothetical protein V4674_01305 [Patescibacteria group bacterium]